MRKDTHNATPQPPNARRTGPPKWGPYLWLGVLFLAGVFLGAGGGAQLLNYARALLKKQPSAPQALNMLANKNQPSAALCYKLIGDNDLHGAFRELDCLVTFRRAFPKKAKGLNTIILAKFTKLHRRLRKESVDWRTVARWKFLYLLSTKMYKVRNQWAKNAEIPVYRVNGHHLAMPFWLKESMRRKVGPLFHLDTHNDMRAVPSPKDVLEAVRKLKANRDTKNAWHTIAHAIYDCAMPVAGGVLTVGYKQVVWGKPSWNGYPEFVNRSFFFARPKSGVPAAILPPDLKGKSKAKKMREFKSMEAKRSHFRLYYDKLKERGLPGFERQDAWVEIQPKQRPVKDKFELFRPFTFTILTTDQPIDSHGRGTGGSTFQKLLKAIPKGRFTLDLDLDYFASIDSADDFKRKAGSDPDWDLDKFAKGRKILKKHLSNFHNLLIALKRNGRIPAVITIADSTYMTIAFDRIAQGQSEYTPIEHTAHIGREVRKIFHKVYGKKVQGREDNSTVLLGNFTPPVHTNKTQKTTTKSAPKRRRERRPEHH
ncbi:MAG TPA: hypothetical protein DCE42_15445 [Myxococcales bacterium]|nr:hypothetical protein [Deltaproteobacteria bacterium]MBU53028.1 hypothetical protein [Deltaproteobacteria bacterium]HAA56158.1 hypothetical protein [Myxococcales bacterium]